MIKPKKTKFLNVNDNYLRSILKANIGPQQIPNFVLLAHAKMLQERIVNLRRVEIITRWVIWLAVSKNSLNSFS